jgi:hypothetical protein
MLVSRDAATAAAPAASRARGKNVVAIAAAPRAPKPAASAEDALPLGDTGTYGRF